MHISQVRKIANREEIDYLFLMDILKDYTNPREKIASWLKTKALIRVKKGLYVFGPEAALEPFSHEILANLIYGPSAISLTYALSLYGFIPERVTTISSITNKRNKEFITPIGNFVYYYLNSQKYSIGIKLYSLKEGKSFLITTPEKALCDQIYLIDRHAKIKKLDEMENYLLHDLRIDEAALKTLNVERLFAINSIFKNTKIKLLINYIQKK